MAFDKDAFLQSLDSMSVMELNDLVKAIEEKFGVSAASMAAPAARALCPAHHPPCPRTRCGGARGLGRSGRWRFGRGR